MLLALDLSMNTGWAAGKVGTRPAFGLWKLPRYVDGAAAQLAAFADTLASAIAVHSPSLVIAEVDCGLHKQNPTDTARQQIGMAALCELICYRKGVRYREATASDARKTILGRSKFNGQAKNIVLEWTNGEGGYGITDHNIGDALVLWNYAAAMSRHHWRLAA